MLGEKIMYNPDDMELVEKYNLLFGDIAVKRGFVSSNQVAEALAEQISNHPSTGRRPLKLISEILLYNGWMTFEQICVVLEELFQNRQEHQTK